MGSQCSTSFNVAERSWSCKNFRGKCTKCPLKDSILFLAKIGSTSANGFGFISGSSRSLRLCILSDGITPNTCNINKPTIYIVPFTKIARSYQTIMNFYTVLAPIIYTLKKLFKFSSVLLGEGFDQLENIQQMIVIMILEYFEPRTHLTMLIQRHKKLFCDSSQNMDYFSPNLSLDAHVWSNKTPLL